MSNIEIYKEKLLLKYHLSSKSEEKINERFNHSLSVVKSSLELVDRFSLPLDKTKVSIAALLHDYAKFSTIDEYKKIIKIYKLKNQLLSLAPSVIHALLGSYIVKYELGIDDEEILSAITYHTTGHANMSLMEEVIFLGDYIEENRQGLIYQKIRKIAKYDLKLAILYSIENNINLLKRGQNPINELTLEAYQYYLNQYNSNNEVEYKKVLSAINHNLVYDIKIYDTRNSYLPVDYVIISTADSKRQVQAVVNYLRDQFTIRGLEIGDTWTLIDLNNIIVHIFDSENRCNYALDRLYATFDEVE